MSPTWATWPSGAGKLLWCDHIEPGQPGEVRRCGSACRKTIRKKPADVASQLDLTIVTHRSEHSQNVKHGDRQDVLL